MSDSAEDVVTPDDTLATLSEWHNTLRQWSGSAFVAGEDVGDTDGAREQLYADLCRIGSETVWMEEQITSLRSELARKEEALQALSLIHDRNPSDAMADMAPVDYARHILFEARQIARAALQTAVSIPGGNDNHG